MAVARYAHTSVGPTVFGQQNAVEQREPRNLRQIGRRFEEVDRILADIELIQRLAENFLRAVGVLESYIAHKGHESGVVSHQGRILPDELDRRSVFRTAQLLRRNGGQLLNLTELVLTFVAPQIVVDRFECGHLDFRCFFVNVEDSGLGLCRKFFLSFGCLLRLLLGFRLLRLGSFRSLRGFQRLGLGLCLRFFLAIVEH